MSNEETLETNFKNILSNKDYFPDGLPEDKMQKYWTELKKHYSPLWKKQESQEPEKKSARGRALGRRRR